LGFLLALKVIDIFCDYIFLLTFPEAGGLEAGWDIFGFRSVSYYAGAGLGSGTTGTGCFCELGMEFPSC